MASQGDPVPGKRRQGQPPLCWTEVYVVAEAAKDTAVLLSGREEGSGGGWHHKYGNPDREERSEDLPLRGQRIYPREWCLEAPCPVAFPEYRWSLGLGHLVKL